MSLSSKCALALATLLGASAIAATPDGLEPYVSEDADAIVLEHVRVIDGTGAAAVEDQRIDIEGGKVTRVVERVETVFKDGVGYDPVKLKRSVEGLMGLR